jgi:recombination protein RecT
MSDTPSSAVSTATPKTFRDMITAPSYQQQIAAALPKGLSVERMTRVVLTAINKTPKLMDCSKESIWESVLNCAALGLFPDALGRAYLVPYKGKCQLIVGYKGLIDLAYRSERIASINLVVVRDGDEFSREPMSMPPIKHKVNEAADGSFRKATHFYSVVYLKGCDHPSIEVMSLREINEIRARSMSANAGPWVTDYEEMAKKTVFRRHAKVLPMSSELVSAMTADQDDIDLTVAPAKQPDRFADDFAGPTADTTAETVTGGSK